jgi:hypothetical protein
MNENWIGAFWDMEQSALQEENKPIILDTELVSVIKPKKRIDNCGPLSSKEVKFLLEVREITENYREQLAEHLRANTFIATKAYSLPLSERTTDWYIFQVLSVAKIPLHISALIQRMETRGWVSKSKHHKYNQIRQVLTDNFYLYQKVAPATFVIRSGFKKAEKVENPKRKASRHTDATIQDLIAATILKHGGNWGMYAGSVWMALNRMGLKYRFNTISNALKDDTRFVCDGFWYQVKPTQFLSEKNDQGSGAHQSKSAIQV